MSDILQIIKARDPGEREFHQAVKEVMGTVKPVLDRNPSTGMAVLERIVEPDGCIFGCPGWMIRANPGEPVQGSDE
jgi:glutamate dehydrogenase (NADP+)